MQGLQRFPSLADLEPLMKSKRRLLSHEFMQVLSGDATAGAETK